MFRFKKPKNLYTAEQIERVFSNPECIYSCEKDRHHNYIICDANGISKARFVCENGNDVYELEVDELRFPRAGSEIRRYLNLASDMSVSHPEPFPKRNKTVFRTYFKKEDKTYRISPLDKFISDIRSLDDEGVMVTGKGNIRVDSVLVGDIHERESNPTITIFDEKDFNHKCRESIKKIKEMAEKYKI